MSCCFGRSIFSQCVVQFRDQNIHFRNELNDAFRDKDDSVIDLFLCPGNNGLGDRIDDLAQRRFLLRDLLGYQADRRACLQRDFQSYMRSGAAHQLNKVPVLAGRRSVLQNIADQLRVDLGRGIKTERDRQQLADLQVAVNGLGDARSPELCRRDAQPARQHWYWSHRRR